MKKILSALLCILLLSALCACGKAAAPAVSAVTPSAAESKAEQPAASPKPESPEKAAEVEPDPSAAPELPFVGTWYAEQDITEALGGAAQIREMAEVWAQLGIEDVSEYISIRSSYIALDLELRADGTARCEADELSLRKAADYYAEDITDTLIRAMEAGIANVCEAEGILPDDLYRESGVEDIYELIPLLIEMPLEEYTQSIAEGTLSELEQALKEITGECRYTAEGLTAELSFPGGTTDTLVYSEADNTLTGERFTLHRQRTA